MNTVSEVHLKCFMFFGKSHVLYREKNTFGESGSCEHVKDAVLVMLVIFGPF